MQDNNTPSDTTQKPHLKRINEINLELIQAERGELKLTLEKIVNHVMEIVYFKALEEGERPVVDLDLARVYKRAYLAAEKCGYNLSQNIAIINFLLQGFQMHIDRYIKSQQKDMTQSLDVS